MRAVTSRAFLGIVAVIVLVLAAGLARAEPRVALVIGNSNYGGDLGLLPNPVNDAKLIAETLRKVGFEVVEVEDADQTALKQAIVDFGDKLSAAGAGATGLFFYAGHGVQMGGENYLIPVHAKLRKPADLDVAAVPINLVLKQMDFAQSAVNIVVLDACRNNPLSDGGRGATRGLAEIKLKPIGSFISFSTAPGQVAEDGSGANSPYSAALADAILQPGLDLAEVFRIVRKSVLKATNQKQEPWDSWSLTDPYYFIPPSKNATPLAESGSLVNPPQGTTVAQIDPKQIELAFWESIKDSSNPADFQAYLDQFTSGSFAVLAANRLKALAQPKPAETDRTVPPAEPPQALVFTAVDQVVFTRNEGALYTAPDENSALISKAAVGLYVRAAGRSPDGAWWQLHLPNGRVAYARGSDIEERRDPATGARAAGAAPVESATGAAQPTSDSAAKEYYDLGEALYGQGDLAGARETYDKAVARDPKSAQAVMRRGQVELALGDLDAALRDLDQAVALDPDALEAHGDRILARLESGDIAGAAQAADAAVAADPSFWAVNVIAAYYFAGRLDDAAAMAERVTQNSPSFGRGWIWRYLVMRAQGRDGEAADNLAAAIDSIGNRDWPVPVLEWMQGKRTAERLLVAAKSGDDAKRSLRQIVEADFFLGESAYSAGDRATAEKLLGQAVDAKAPDLLATAAARALLAKMARE